MAQPRAALAALGFRYDPDDLYPQTVAAVLAAAESMDLPMYPQLILAQPKNELMRLTRHFPAAQRVKQAAQRYGCDLRTAAHAAALDPIAKVYRQRGIFP